jgi:protein-tyrosine phosphatase
MAEGMFKKMIVDKGLETEFIVESRATSTWEIGNPPHPGTQKILERIGFDWRGMKAKQIEAWDYANFDYIIGMDNENVNFLTKQAGSYADKVYLMRDINEKTKNQDVPDPYFNNKHEETFLLLQESLEHWFQKLVK